MGFFGGKETNFFRLLIDQASKTLEGVQALAKYLETLDGAQGQNVKKIEMEADEIRRVLVEEINRTFVTPVDREDLFALSRAIDDVLDYANTTVYEFEVYALTSADHHVKRLVEIIHDQAHELLQAIKTLESYPRVANEHAVKAKKAENLMERAYREALRDLFAGSDTVHMLKMREIYRHLSNAADRGDEAANTIHSIVVKRGGS
jgi:predicted phosphate transport protein (TIGR00153 family)